MAGMQGRRRLPVGAEVLMDRGVHFRVWAPRRQKVAVVLEGGTDHRLDNHALTIELAPESNGYFSGQVATAHGDTLYPDPVSRFQPQGPHGPSQVIDPDQFSWSDHHWRGSGLLGQVLYELHVGTFTREGTWEAAGREVPQLAELGVTVIEMMPVADFPGRFGWGYDGVDLFAPSHLYGTPDDLRAFIDRAHSLGLGV